MVTKLHVFQASELEKRLNIRLAAPQSRSGTFSGLCPSVESNRCFSDRKQTLPEVRESTLFLQLMLKVRLHKLGALSELDTKKN
jgi:hypothetical protein